MTEFRARCKKHKDWHGEWTPWRSVLKRDLSEHVAADHPKEKHPDRAVKRGIKRIREAK